MNELFGTDGIRGIPGKHPFTGDFLVKIGYCAAKEILSKHWSAEPVAVMGRDSRGSGPNIARLLAKGMQSAGCAVVDIGVAPTPAVSYLVPRTGAVCGIVISASHNPPEFNGIKFFSKDGIKLASAIEHRIERRLAGRVSVPKASPQAVKASRTDCALVERYVDFLAGTMPPDTDLRGMSIVLDCANGAAYKIAAGLLSRLGARTQAIGCDPDGDNINMGCGALHTEAMRRETVRLNADCGFSLDGDADRVIFSDETGAELDGDDLIGMAALELKSQGLLKSDKVVLTVMSNYGLEHRLREDNISTVRVPVGDKHVSKALHTEDLSLGGESSGHIIFRAFAPTGDGLLTAVQILALLRRSGRKLSYFRKNWFRYPNLLKAVPVAKKIPLEKIPGFDGKLKECERRLGGDGRLLVRYSGTEPKLRVLVEGPNEKLVRDISEDIILYYTTHAEEAVCR